MGLFAMRGPRRPNPIGLHLVRIVSVRDDGFIFAGVDMLDGTPLLDVKPWVAPADVPIGRTVAPSVRCGWFDDVSFDRGQTPRSLGDGPGEV
jgi:tRNA (Thr-GGU) A37 N-methylase